MKKAENFIYVVLLLVIFVGAIAVLTSVYKQVDIDEMFASDSVSESVLNSFSVSTSVSVSNQNNSDKEVITFTLNNFTYSAEIGMTWGDWVVSKYGDRNYYWILGNYIGCDDYASNDSGNVVYYVADTAGNKITVSEYIVPFYNYTIVYETVPF